MPTTTKRRRLRRAVIAALAASFLPLPVVPARAVGGALPIHTMPVRGHRHAGGLPGRYSGRGVKVAGNGIDHHGGAVMLGQVHVYVIWYGDWSKAVKRQGIITGFLRALAPSPWWSINTTYSDTSGHPLANDLTLAGQVSDAGSQGTKQLSDDAIQKVVTTALDTGKLPTDANGIYLVLTAATVSKSGFLTDYCGWHTHIARRNGDVKFAFVGDPGTKGLRVCGAQAVGPNGDAAGDAMVSVIAHELTETVTDPDLDAWYDAAGDENADKCAWTWGTTHKVAGGALANVRLGTKQYLLQQNWRNAGGGSCVLAP